MQARSMSLPMDKRSSRSYGTGSISLPNGSISPSFFYDEFSSVQSRTFLKWCGCSANTSRHTSYDDPYAMLSYPTFCCDPPAQAQHASRNSKHPSDAELGSRSERWSPTMSTDGACEPIQALSQHYVDS